MGVIGLGEKACFPHFHGAFIKCTNNPRNVGVAMLGRQEAREALQYVDSFLTEVVIEQTREPLLGGKAEIENAAKTFYARRNRSFFEAIIDRPDHLRCALGKPSPAKPGPVPGKTEVPP